jgi:hypothetical protein
MVEKLKALIPFFISFLIMALTIIIEYVTVGTRDSFDFKDFIMTFTINAGILIIMLIVWRPSGKDSIRNNPGSSYSVNASQYSNLVSSINSSKLNAKFKAFCKDKTNELLQEKKAYILNKHDITIEDYDKYLEKDASFNPTRKQKKILKNMESEMQKLCQ